MRRCDQPPRLMKALFPSVCPETGRAIKRGDQIAYFPAKRKAYHSESQSAALVRAMNSQGPRGGAGHNA